MTLIVTTQFIIGQLDVQRLLIQKSKLLKFLTENQKRNK